jgi:uncharacterized protein YcgI (DUF1989 family)
MSREQVTKEAKEREVLRMHAVPGKIRREFVIPAKEYASLTMKEGQTLRFVDMEGKQVPDVACFNAHDLSEEINMGNTLLINKRRELVTAAGANRFFAQTLCRRAYTATEDLRNM